MNCCIAGCADEVYTIHGGYAYCEYHMEWVWDLPGGRMLTGDQQYVAVEQLDTISEHLFGDDGPPPLDDANRGVWGEIRALAVEYACGRLVPDGDDLAAVAARLWQERTGTPAPRLRTLSP